MNQLDASQKFEGSLAKKLHFWQPSGLLLLNSKIIPRFLASINKKWTVEAVKTLQMIPFPVPSSNLALEDKKQGL